jgi:hypothetical protein
MCMSASTCLSSFTKRKDLLRGIAQAFKHLMLHVAKKVQWPPPLPNNKLWKVQQIRCRGGVLDQHSIGQGIMRTAALHDSIKSRICLSLFSLPHSPDQHVTCAGSGTSAGSAPWLVQEHQALCQILQQLQSLESRSQPPLACHTAGMQAVALLERTAHCPAPLILECLATVRHCWQVHLPR